MNSLIGKSTGLALLMAAALLAALFAMGVFAPMGAGAHGAHTSGSDAHKAQLDILTALEGAVGASDPTVKGTNTDALAGTNVLAPYVGETPADTGSVTAEAADADSKGYTLTVSKRVDTNTKLAIAMSAAAGAKITGVTVDGSDTGVTVYEGFAGSPVAAEAPSTPADATVFDDTDISPTSTIAVEIVVPHDKTPISKIEVTVSDIGGTTNAVKHTAQTYTINVMYTNAASSKVAGAAVELNVEAEGTTVQFTPGQSFNIVFGEGISLPSTFSKTDVLLTNNANIARPAAGVSLNGRSLKVTVPDMNGDGDGSPGITTDDTPTGDSDLKVQILQSAGITNPDAAGVYPVLIKSGVGDNVVTHAANMVTVNRSISLSPKKGGSTADVTVTGKGFTVSDATVFIDKSPGATAGDDATYTPDGKFTKNVDMVLASGQEITDGSFTTVLAGIAKPEDQASVTINARDGNGLVAAEGAVYTFGAGLSASPASLSWGETLTLTMTDNDDIPKFVRFGGSTGVIAPVLANATAKTAKVDIPAAVLVGKQNVELMQGTENAKTLISGLSTTVEIVPLTLTISLTDVVPNQQITISGSGFEEKDQAIGTIEIGGKDVPTTGRVTTTGQVQTTVRVPTNVGTGEKTVTVMAGSRTGEAKITVAKPAITITPTESPVGSKITATGTGFAADSDMELLYGDNFQAIGKSTSSGEITIEATVPDSGIGKTSKVKVQVRGHLTISATADHSTPGSSITVSPTTVQEGGKITISGMNFAGSSPISQVTVGGDKVATSPDPLTTGRDGSISFTAIAPVGVGTKTVLVKDGKDNTASVSITVSSTPVSSAPADVFMSLGDRVARVWHFDASKQNTDESPWSFWDPREAVPDSLTMVSSGQVYIIIITAGESVEFQGSNLYPGTNYHSLD